MPCLSGSYVPQIGIIVNVIVFPAGSITPTTPPKIEVKAFPALLDTGATNTCISTVVADAIGINPIGMQPMTSATHIVPVNVFLVDLLLPFGSAGFIISNAQVMEFKPTMGSPFVMLLGRDIICRGALTMSFDGHFTLSL